MLTLRNHTKGFSKIDKLIFQNAKEHNFEQALYKYRIVKCWREVAGSFVEEAKEMTQALDLKKGVLLVACLSREVARKLKVLAANIVSALNQLLGKQVVFALCFEV
ncbi:MAG: DciA family protein [Patescibacteria group bacterium]